MFARITYNSDAKLERTKLIPRSCRLNAYRHMPAGTSIGVYLENHAFASIFSRARRHFTGLPVFEVVESSGKSLHNRPSLFRHCSFTGKIQMHELAC